jgi:hypothetical protein
VGDSKINMTMSEKIELIHEIYPQLNRERIKTALVLNQYEMVATFDWLNRLYKNDLCTEKIN